MKPSERVDSVKSAALLVIWYLFSPKQEMLGGERERGFLGIYFYIGGFLMAATGFCAALFRYDTGFVVACRYAISFAVFPFISVYGTYYAFVVPYVAFFSFNKGIYKTLSESWIKKNQVRFPGAKSFDVPHWRFAIPSFLFAAASALLLFLLTIGFIRLIFTVLIPDGLPMPFLGLA